MNIQSCFHPRKLLRKPSYTDFKHDYKKYVYVNCGMCPACLNRRMLSAVDRIEDESRKHKFCYHVTLTYSEDKAHYFEFTRLTPSLIVARWSDWFTISNDSKCSQVPLLWKTFFKPDDNAIYTDKFSVAEWEDACRYADGRSAYGDNRLRYMQVRDIQLLLKSIRRQLEYHYGIKGEIRYYAVPEFSPTKLRPHWHVLFWFDSVEISWHIRELVSKVWKFGFSKCKLAVGRQRSYVAKYINSIASYPPLLKTKDTLPHAVFSRKPSIGNDEVPNEIVREMYVNRNFDFMRRSGTKLENVSFSQTFESRWFPKCREFSTLTHFGRVTRYSFYFAVHKNRENISLRFNPDLDRIADSEIVKELHENFWQYDFYNDVFPTLGVSDYYISRKVYKIAKFFNYSVDKVVSIIEDYYSHKELNQLKQFYEFQQDFTQENPSVEDLNQLASLYPVALHDWCVLMDYFPHSAKHGFNEDYVSSLLAFGLSFKLKSNQNQLHLYYQHPSIEKWKENNRRMAHDNMKTKEYNDKVNLFDKI